ncbi:DUF5994 family protein [Streptomyces griseoloalbus]|uniref:DUF5994 family protein n=1 Tax=Streptomyces griseoloalbus TaxID=67303 RepID=A0ABV3DZ38_9ACTN
MSAAPQPPAPSHPLLRLRLAPHGGACPSPLTGGWPRSCDVLAELPGLLDGLPRAWGHITSVTVNGTVWSAVPGRFGHRHPKRPRLLHRAPARSERGRPDRVATALTPTVAGR